MAYESCVLDGLFAIRWGAEPELADVPKYMAELAQARARQAAPLVGMFIMPSDSKIPSDAFRKVQADALPAIMEHLDFCVAVFEGSGFIIAVKRGALGAILLLAPRRFSIHVRSSAREALIDDPPKPIRFDGARALLELKRRHLIT